MASLLPISLSLLLLFHVSLAQTEQESQRPFESQNVCQIERLNAQEPTRRVESEAGRTEYFDERNQQFQCAGVAAQLRFIQPKGLLLPSFLNAPRLVYIVQGKGLSGTVFPGCPESFQSFEHQEPQKQEGRQKSTSVRDQHQRITQFQKGDVLVIPAGVAHWAYNNGDQPVIAITIIHTSSNDNQLDPNSREFLLAGSKQSGEKPTKGQSQQEDSDNNILSGFENEALVKVIGASRELVDKLKGKKDHRGEIVNVEGDFDVVIPSGREDREESEHEEEREGKTSSNGFEQAFCYLKTKYNIDNPARADVYNPNAGRLTSLNSQKLPLLRFLRLSAARVVLNKNAFIAPLWNINAHAVVYVTQGNGQIQVVNNHGNKVHDAQLRQGQILVIPQNFAVLTQAQSEGFNFVVFYTNDNAMFSPIVGKLSVLKGIPVEVIMNSYRISREEARMVKFNRDEEKDLFVQRPMGIRSYA